MTGRRRGAVVAVTEAPGGTDDTGVVSADTVAPLVSQTLEVLPLALLVPAEDNLREELGDLTELAASIRANGIVEPPIVTPIGDGRYRINCGNRRHGAGLLAGLVETPCVVREMSDFDRTKGFLVENLQRNNLTALEEAEGYRRLAAEGLTQRQISQEVGVPQGTISKRLALLDLTPAAKAALRANQVNLADAAELVRLRNEPERLDALVARFPLQSWLPTARAVNDELALAEAARKQAAAIAECETKGLRVVMVDRHDYGFYSRRPERLLGRGEGQVPLTARAHAKLACHAAAIDGQGQIKLVCTAPTSHPEYKAGDTGRGGGGQKLTDKQKAERAETRRRNKALKEATAARAEVMAAMVRAKMLPQDALEVVARTWFTRLSDYNDREQLRRACTLLGLEPETDQWGRKSYTDAILASYAGKGTTQLTRTMLAVALAFRDLDAENGYYRQEGVRTHVAYLEGHGYKPTDFETVELGADAASPRQRPRPTRTDPDDVDPDPAVEILGADDGADSDHGADSRPTPSVASGLNEEESE